MQSIGCYSFDGRLLPLREESISTDIHQVDRTATNDFSFNELHLPLVGLLDLWPQMQF